MVKRSVTIAALLLILPLAAFASNVCIESTSCSSVPEPGSLLVFGSGLLLGFRVLKSKLGI